MTTNSYSHLLSTATQSKDCQGIPNSKRDLTDVTLRLFNTAHGIDDYDVEGSGIEVHRVCIPHGIKRGDNFNLYLKGSRKQGGIWRGSLKSSLKAYFTFPVNITITKPVAC